MSGCARSDDGLVSGLAKLMHEWDIRLGAPPCPCCGKQMKFIDKDEYGAGHAECDVHGVHTFQVAP